ncbi:MAG TPA: hypothetical protein VJX67_15545 [Blastocatellia bacterium]|nr:hypothetical protein [Blastocatellia bacterium]
MKNLEVWPAAVARIKGKSKRPAFFFLTGVKANIILFGSSHRIMGILYVFAASKMEARPIQQALRRYGAKPVMPFNNLGPDIRGSVDLQTARVPWKAYQAGATEVVIVRAGIGPRAAQASAAAVFQQSGAHAIHAPRDVNPERKALILGLGGSLAASIPESSTVVYSSCLSTEAGRPRISCDVTLTDFCLRVLRSGGIDCRSGVGISSSRIAASVEEKRSLRQCRPDVVDVVDVVDMESYEILSAAAVSNVPATVVRAISDSSQKAMPDFNHALSDDGDFNPFMLAFLAVLSPLATAHLCVSSRRALGVLKRGASLLLDEKVLAGAYGPAPIGVLRKEDTSETVRGLI